ncbi:hypothetical protein TPHA_0M00420 [Tetrapisispora phaffii CBS 4417]|uniref:Uncharacterized protein n=1 Tax=Tetrapisispora phaffii (strain ATCC 24235 / CBS 4417 / NBRC 1672 / NRRL Y-8282 / UCD 70-5) TaxID=1071381 RepID=G8C0V6_TETPH|nr:hypothetical protein TPHA_0M00420 [Tetrapisispora phaffii CBS 4417]CCE65617.1 hypothetical protein TPHA_0M00420 [Tetrapisispora phaffii CBS 4417]
MSLEGSNNANDKSVNTKRLSLMLDSLQANVSDSSDERAETVKPSTVEQGPISNMLPPNNGMYSVANRSSFISSYSGVVEEGIAVSFMNNTNSGSERDSNSTFGNSSETVQKIPLLPTLPLQENVNSFIPKEKKSGSQQVKRFDSLPSTPSPTQLEAITVQRYSSLRSSKSNKASNNLKTILVEPSTPTASKNQIPIILQSPQEDTATQMQKEEDKDESDDSIPEIRITSRVSDTDMESVSSSVLEPLLTTVERANSGKDPIRSETNEYNPSIPPRNSRRPCSKIHVPEVLVENVESETYGHADAPNSDEILSQEHSKHPPPSSIQAEDAPVQRNLGTIEPFSQVDPDALSRMISFTNGTLVSSEFSKLDMQMEEKKVLEQLVDALTRLAADMISDPERFDEGIRRMDKATKDLEGFSEHI